MLDDLLRHWSNLRRWWRRWNVWLHFRQQEPDVRDLQLWYAKRQLRETGQLRDLQWEHMRQRDLLHSQLYQQVRCLRWMRRHLPEHLSFTAGLRQWHMLHADRMR